MAGWFARNIDRKGRVARLVWGVLLVAPGLGLAFAGKPWIGGGLVLLGAFSLFEAARGWCVLRACGIRTRF